MTFVAKVNPRSKRFPGTLQRLSSLSAVSLVLLLLGTLYVSSVHAEPSGKQASHSPRPEGPCDIYADAGTPCVAAHSTTRALYANYDGPLYQVLRQSDGKTTDIGVVRRSAKGDTGGYADAPAQDAFCAHTICWISTIYDQSSKRNHLTQAPRGGFSGPALGGLNNLPLADAAPVSLLGHKVYGVFIVPGMGLRNDDARGTAVDDQAEGQYWVINGRHFNSGCCFDYGNAEIDSRDDDNGTMETAYFGDTLPWFHGTPPGPWVMTDQENNLVGCVVTDDSKLCPNLPSITWRFVTAMAKGEPHHWASLGGDAQTGNLAVMFNGRRVDATYDPMRKQGAILLGNGGDNSNGSQGTFYEGAMTAAGTFPTDATDQRVQANVVAARYDVQGLRIAPRSALDTPPGVQTFTPGSTQATVVTFTNTTNAPVTGLRLTIKVPDGGWRSSVDRTEESQKSFAETIAPGKSVNATFQVSAGPRPQQSELMAAATWTDGTTQAPRSDTAVERVRSASAVKINEFRVSAGDTNPTDTFIELFNAGSADVDLSNWTLVAHPTQQAVFGTMEIAAGTRLAAGGFYLLGLANSGLAAQARAGDRALYLRNTTGMSAGDTLRIGDGTAAESHRIASVGKAAADHTTLWQPLPDGPVITVPAGSINVPVQSTAGFTVGEKIALGYGATYPAVGRDREQFEIATVTAVGKPGTQAYLATDAPAGATNLKVTSIENISEGDTIRLDVESLGHGVETVTVLSVGTRAHQTNLTAAAAAGATKVLVRRVDGIAAGDRLMIGTPATQETVTVTSIGAGGTRSIDFQPALGRAHVPDEWVVSPGTGLNLSGPLKFTHAANLPFSDRGTGISFSPPTKVPHASNEPLQALGTSVTLDGPLAREYGVNTAVRDVAVKTAGYQGPPVPNQWFGGPELTTRFLQFGRMLTEESGSLLLRDANGVLADSVNYGAVVDPWAAEGYQAVSGGQHNGCYAPAPSAGVSAGRTRDGLDTDSNCDDFAAEAVTSLSSASAVGSQNLKVADVRGFHAGQTIHIGSGAEQESAVLTSVGSSGGTTLAAAAPAGQTEIPIASAAGFAVGQSITIGSDDGGEAAVIKAVDRRAAPRLTLFTALTRGHMAGAQVTGSGLRLDHALLRSHAHAAAVTGNAATPGAPNGYWPRSSEHPLVSRTAHP